MYHLSILIHKNPAQFYQGSFRLKQLIILAKTNYKKTNPQ